jgi:hypothetical protein
MDATCPGLANTAGSPDAECTGGSRTIGALATDCDVGIAGAMATDAFSNDGATLVFRSMAQPDIATETATNKIAPADADQTRNNSLPP